MRPAAVPSADAVNYPSVPPRMERSGNPGSRVARHGLDLRLWAPDQVRGGIIGFVASTNDRRL